MGGMRGVSEGAHWLTPSQAAEYISVTRTTIHRWIKGGTLKGYPLPTGGGYRIRRSDLDALLEHGTQPEA